MIVYPAFNHWTDQLEETSERVQSVGKYLVTYHINFPIQHIFHPGPSVRFPASLLIPAIF
jgi:hypothetical protein